MTDEVTFETARGEDIWKLPTLTPEQIDRLPASIELAYAARAIGIGRSLAFGQARKLGRLECGQARVPVRKVGAMWRCLKSDLVRELGLTVSPSAAGHAAVDPVALDALEDAAEALERAAASIRKALRRLGR